MAYLGEFKERLNNSDFTRFLQLWEEYSNIDTVDADELIQLLQMIKKSDLATRFGDYVETVFPLWNEITDPTASYEVLRLLIDLETANSPSLADLALKAITTKHGNDPHFKERLRLVGLRNKQNFKGAITNYELLAHMAPGKFVFHTGGWGTGEILDLSLIREQVVIEFENINGRRDMSFENSFKTLIPLPDDHFLARRFGNPDLLEKEARENPLEIIRLLLRDLGPKTAAEIKDELAEWVIPEGEWTKWWQGTRAKIKKDTLIEAPSSLRDPFRLRKNEMQHEERLHKEIHGKTNILEILQTTYNYVRDFPQMLKKAEVKESIKEKLLELFKDPELTPDLELQVVLFLEHFLNHKVKAKSVSDLIDNRDDLEDIVNAIDILALKKRALTAIRQYHKEWVKNFLALLFSIQQNALRDYLLQELNQKETVTLLKKKLEELLHHPAQYPEIFVWYFQQVVSKQDIPFCDKEGQCQFLEGFMILFNKLEAKPEYRELLKKMYNILSGDRYAIVRSVIADSSEPFIKEFLLLVSKCQTLSDHDVKILRSLAEVAHPSLAKKKTKGNLDKSFIWTTEEGYFKTKEHIQKLGTVDLVDIAKEIETARAHGDLRENAEYKAALEKRSRLQSELRVLSDLLNRARIITKEDISTDEVGIGVVVDVENSEGKRQSYTILGPWDANPENNVLSFQSKLAECLLGCRKDETYTFRDEEFTVKDIRSFL